MSLFPPPTRRRVLGLLACGMTTAWLSADRLTAEVEDDGGGDQGLGSTSDHDGGTKDGDDGQSSSDRDGGRGSAGPDSRSEASLSQSGRCPGDITVHYPDGWTERIVDGSYEMLDPQSQLVVRRCATTEDFDRLIAVR